MVAPETQYRLRYGHVGADLVRRDRRTKLPADVDRRADANSSRIPLCRSGPYRHRHRGSERAVHGDTLRPTPSRQTVKLCRREHAPDEPAPTLARTYD